MKPNHWAGRLQTLFTQEDIARQVSRLAGEINRDYAGKKLVVVCVLKGGFMFFSDLVKKLDLGPELDFVRVSSYGSGTESLRTVNLVKDIEISVDGKDVLLVEDVVDTGHTLRFLIEHMEARGAKSVRIASMVDKHERREAQVDVDYAGFHVPDGFIVGYGLDYAEKGRELPAIYVLRQDHA